MFFITSHTYSINLDESRLSKPIDNDLTSPLPCQLLTDNHSISKKRPPRIVGQLAMNAAFIVPDQIRKKFIDGWNTHVPLTFLTDKACSSKNISNSLNSMQDYITIDDTSSRFMLAAKPLPSDGELDLTFDEWHQVWRHLLHLIAYNIPSSPINPSDRILSLLNSVPQWFHL